MESTPRSARSTLAGGCTRRALEDSAQVAILTSSSRDRELCAIPLIQLSTSSLTAVSSQESLQYNSLPGLALLSQCRLMLPTITCIFVTLVTTVSVLRWKLLHVYQRKVIRPSELRRTFLQLQVTGSAATDIFQRSALVSRRKIFLARTFSLFRCMG